MYISLLSGLFCFCSGRYLFEHILFGVVCFLFCFMFWSLWGWESMALGTLGKYSTTECIFSQPFLVRVGSLELYYFQDVESLIRFIIIFCGFSFKFYNTEIPLSCNVTTQHTMIQTSTCVMEIISRTAVSKRLMVQPATENCWERETQFSSTESQWVYQLHPKAGSMSRVSQFKLWSMLIS